MLVLLLMVGSLTNDDPDCEMPKKSLGTSGSIPTAQWIRGGVFVDGDIYVTGSVDCISTGRLEARHSVADGLPKKFDIPHPSEKDIVLLMHVLKVQRLVFIIEVD